EKMTDIPFIGVYRSLYPYQPQQDPELVVTENRELELEENELLYVLEKGEDLWWKVKKKAPSDQEDGDVGLVPGNYLEECQPIYQVRTLYDYEQQSCEEISFNEGEILDVFDEDNENWVFARCGMLYGFAPSNYLEKISDNTIVSSSNITESQTNSNSNSLHFRESYSHTSPQSTKKTGTTKETSFSILSQHTSFSNKSPKNSNRIPEKTFHHKVLESSEVLDAYAVSNEPYSFDSYKDNSIQNVKTWVVHEIDKKKRKKGILCVGNNNITFSNESDKKPLQIWPITSVIRYSFEKKHLFIDVYSDDMPISFDFHAGSSEAASEIYFAIENLANIARSSDDATNNDWWKVRQGDSEGLVPASYIKYCPRDSKNIKKMERYHNESQKLEKKVHSEKKTNKPQLDKIKTWTDRTGTFKVDAQFLGVVDNKIHLHKLNGVKISVPLSKMSAEDVLYVESLTDSSKNKQNTDINTVSNDSKYDKTKNKNVLNKTGTTSTSRTKNNYDWFDFFLSCGVKYNLCQTYATNFENDNLTESDLQDLTSENMRTLGIREDDIIRVTRYIREKYKSKDKLDTHEIKLETNKPKAHVDSASIIDLDTSKKNESNSLSSLSSEKLKNSIKSIKPQRLQNSSTTNTDSLSQSKNKEFSLKNETPTSGFDDDAWSIKSSNTQKIEPSNLLKPEVPNSQLAYAVKNLSLLTPPMNPTHASPISSQFSQQQIQQNILPLTQPVSQTTLQNQYGTVDPLSASFTNVTFNLPHAQPFYNYNVTNIPTVASQQCLSSSVMYPNIPQFQPHTFQPQTEFGQKIQQQIIKNPPYMNSQLLANQAHVMHNLTPLTHQDAVLPLDIQNNGYNNSISQQTITMQQPFHTTSSFHRSVSSQYDNSSQQPLFFQQNTQQSLVQHQPFQNNFIIPQTLENMANNSSFSTLPQSANTSTSPQQNLVFKPVKFGASKLPQSNYPRKRANLAAATPENPFGLAVGLNRGHKTTPHIIRTRISRRKGFLSKRVSFIRDTIREVVGFAPYERRIIELLRNSKDKRARRFAKRRLGTFLRAKKKIEKLTHFISESRKTSGH
ncbi:hypothetical protein PORY_000526, partial [Pneumocystis oryctolagi]